MSGAQTTVSILAQRLRSKRTQRWRQHNTAMRNALAVRKQHGCTDLSRISGAIQVLHNVVMIVTTAKVAVSVLAESS
jgi:hypothetical protein